MAIAASIVFVSPLLSCQKIDIAGSESDASSLVKKVSFVIPELVDDDALTRTYLDNGGNFLWDDRDTVGIYPDTGSQIFFSMTGGAGSSSATFDGGGWALKSSSTYYSYYPFIGDIYLNKNRIPVSYSGQQVQNVDDTSYIGAFFYMFAHGTAAEGGSLAFNYDYLSTLIRVTATLGAGTYTKMALMIEDPLFVEEGYYDLTSDTPEIVPTKNTDILFLDLGNLVLNTSTTFKVYFLTAPVNLTGKTVTVAVLDSNRKEYDCLKTPSAAYEAGHVRGLTCSSFTAVSQSMGVGIDNWGDGGSISGNAE